MIQGQVLAICFLKNCNMQVRLENTDFMTEAESLGPFDFRIFLFLLSRTMGPLWNPQGTPENLNLGLSHL